MGNVISLDSVLCRDSFVDHAFVIQRSVEAHSNELSCLSAIPTPETLLSMASIYSRAFDKSITSNIALPSGFPTIPDNGNARSASTIRTNDM